MTQSVGIIGAGISGISAAYLLQHNYAVTLLEKNAYFGGHSNTIDIISNERTVPVDTGFIVFNHRTYDNLVPFFKEIGVETVKSDMSFGVSFDKGRLEYCGSSLSQFFAQRKNIINPKFIKMGLDILKFNKSALASSDDSLVGITLDQYVESLNLSSYFKEWYLYPMAGAIWSTNTADIGGFPAASFVRFFRNHGLLSVTDQPQWYTVKKGSRCYVEKALASENINKLANAGVKTVKRMGDHIEVKTSAGELYKFDHVILASHAPETLSMLVDPSPQEQRVLSNFKYSKNVAYLHKDKSLLPKRKAAWASWNFLSEPGKAESVTYWMNQLQPLNTEEDIFVSLNPPWEPEESLTYRKINYEHPLFDAEAIQSQEAMNSIQGQDRIWYAGAYQRYGFHEDGILSALKVVNALGVKAPWQ